MDWLVYVSGCDCVIQNWYILFWHAVVMQPACNWNVHKSGLRFRNILCVRPDRTIEWEGAVGYDWVAKFIFQASFLQSWCIHKHTMDHTDHLKFTVSLTKTSTVIEQASSSWSGIADPLVQRDFIKDERLREVGLNFCINIPKKKGKIFCHIQDVSPRGVSLQSWKLWKTVKFMWSRTYCL